MTTMKEIYLKPKIDIIEACDALPLCGGSEEDDGAHHSQAKGWQPVGEDLWDDAWGKKESNESDDPYSLPKPVSVWE